jgi:hypothetical protein
MNAQEFRIGNLIEKSLKSGQGRKLIDKIGCQDIVRIFENTGSFNYEPISLTEEWFLKLGFGLRPWGWVNKEADRGLRITVHNNFEREGNTSLKIQYVHQLQNLYYALTGVELSVS